MFPRTLFAIMLGGLLAATPAAQASSGDEFGAGVEVPDTTAVPSAKPTGDLSPAPPPGPVPSAPARGAKTGIYVHVGGGGGLAFMSSDEITDLFGDEFAIGLGFHLSYSVALGYLNILQGEIRRGDSAHTLRDNNIVTRQTTEIPMDYDYTEYVAKANLLALTATGRRNRELALFIVGGSTEIEYLDETGDGFKGKGNVFGVEFARVAPGGAATVAVGVRRYGIEFDRITLLGQTVPFDIEASNWVFHTAVTFGLGL